MRRGTLALTLKSNIGFCSLKVRFWVRNDVSTSISIFKDTQNLPDGLVGSHLKPEVETATAVVVSRLLQLKLPYQY